MRDFTTLKSQLDPNSHALHVQCPCRLDITYKDETEFKADGGEIINETPLFVTCPRCSGAYAAQATTEPHTKNETRLRFTLKLGKNSRKPPRIPDGECPECETPIYPSHYHEDEHAPETGWRYYHCENCNTAVPPQEFNISPPDATTPTKGTQ